jgi:RHS repeat-associated protein
MIASPITMTAGSGFTSKERDAETGLDYFGARYLSAAQGRFTSPDKPFADQHANDPQTWNLYAYAHNNPTRFVDITGRAGVPPCNGDDQECQARRAALEQQAGDQGSGFFKTFWNNLKDNYNSLSDHLGGRLGHVELTPLSSGEQQAVQDASPGVGLAITVLSALEGGEGNTKGLNVGSGTRAIRGAINLDNDVALIGNGPNVIGDVTALPFKSGSIPSVEATKLRSLVMGTQGPEAASELFRVLQPGGTVRLQSATPFNPELRQTFVGAGFKNVKLSGNVITATK